MIDDENTVNFRPKKREIIASLLHSPNLKKSPMIVKSETIIGGFLFCRKGEDGMTARGQPVKICHVGGRVFKIFREYDERAQSHYLTYPDFTERPEYTCDGKPFARSDKEDCLRYESKNPDDPYEECGDCRFFRREESPRDVIGICDCAALVKKRGELP